MFDNLRTRRRRKPSEEIPLWKPNIKDTIIEPALEQWPQVRDQAITLLKAGRDKFSEAYVSIAETLTEKKEAWEDRRAGEKYARQQARAAENTQDEENS
jgi:hypothetical protein